MKEADRKINIKLNNLLTKFNTFKAPGRGSIEDFENLQKAYEQVYKAIGKEEDPEVAAGEAGNNRLITLLELVGYEPTMKAPGGKGMLEEDTITKIHKLRPILFPDQYAPIMTDQEAAIFGGKKTKKQ